MDLERSFVNSHFRGKIARMTRLKLLLLGILRKIDQLKRSKHQNTARNKHYIMAKSRRFCRDLQRILKMKKWRRSENFDKIGILRICGVTARSHIRLPTSTFTRCTALIIYKSFDYRFTVFEVTVIIDWDMKCD